MAFQILAILVALSLPALLVIEEINSWRRSHKAPEKQVALGAVARGVAPEPGGAVERPRAILRAPQRKTA